ncbi:MAG: prepilin-type N-terminal cleavage/methylation domain-containing protein [Elusimicrobiaceae bacterium]|nr:prepilin-type N-terminal cleavage/methylation domain-containing protein [Elusimicrobiaceae bacterium]
MNNNRGFTLTEVLLAATIVGVIGVAVVALTTSAMREGSMGRSRQALRNEISISMRQLRNDLQNAKKVAIVNNANGTLNTLTIYQREFGNAMRVSNDNNVKELGFRNYDFERIGPKSTGRWSDQSGYVSNTACAECKAWRNGNGKSLGQLYTENPACNVELNTTCDAYAQLITYTFTAGSVIHTPEGSLISPALTTSDYVKRGGNILRAISGLSEKSTWLNNVKAIAQVNGYPSLPSCQFEDTDALTGGTILTCRFLVELSGSPAVNEYVKETFMLPYGVKQPPAEE